MVMRQGSVRRGSKRHGLPPDRRRLAVLLGVALTGLGAVASPAASAAECPPVPVRPLLGVTPPSGCYVYEKVSPSDKGKGEVAGGGTSLATLGFRATPSGAHIVYPSDGHFLGNASPGLQYYYLASQGPTAWSSASPTAVLPYMFPEDFLVTPLLPSRITPVGVSDDGKMVLGTNVDPATQEVVPNALYVVDAKAGTRMRITPPPVAGDPVVKAEGGGLGGTADYSTVYFGTTAQLTDEARAPGVAASVEKLYRYRDGKTELASFSPSGSPSSGQLVDAAASGNGRGGFNSISQDGNVFWFVENTGYFGAGVNQIHRGDSGDTRSTFVNASENTGTLVPPGPAQFLGASPDGSRAVFSSTQRLVDGVNQTGTGANLYLYTHSGNPAQEKNLTLISADNEPADGTDVTVTMTLGVSGDARTVYFASQQQLVAGETTAPGSKIYRWHDGTLEFLTMAVPDQPLYPATTEDGRYLTLRSSSSGVTADDNRGLVQLYVYDAEANKFTCASCRASGPSTAAVPADISSYSLTAQPRRWISDDGGVLFLTAEALQPEDTNGKVDLYRWKDGVAQLVSTGRGTHDVLFGDASRDGSSVFFVTDEQLSGWDTDLRNDLYVARLNGGLPEPNLRPTEPCGDQCQGPPPPPQPAAAPGSTIFTGSGNLLPTPLSNVALTAKLKVSKVKTVHGTSTKVKVKVGSKGRIRTSGSGLKREHKTAKKAGSYRVSVKLSKRARRTLRRKHRVKVRVTVRFIPKEGKRTSTRVHVTFKPEKRHRSSTRATRRATVLSSASRKDR